MQAQALMLKVTVLEGWSSTIRVPHAVAFYRGTEIANKKESERLNNPVWTNDHVTLRVTQPQAGIYYAVSWMPPRRTKKDRHTATKTMLSNSVPAVGQH